MVEKKYLLHMSELIWKLIKKCLELHIKGDILNVISLVKEITQPINALVDEIKHQACWQTPDLRTEKLGAVAGGC